LKVFCTDSFVLPLPVVITMAGGYARQVQDTVDIHFQTVQIASRMARLKDEG
jgi:hypothetical protein